MGDERNPWVVVAMRSILLFMKHLNGCIFPLLGDISRSLHVDKEIVEVGQIRGGQLSAARTAGSLVPLLSSLAHPVLRQSFHPWSCSSRSDGANGRCGNRSPIAGSSLGDFVIRRVPKYPAHLSRMRTLSFSSVPSSPMMNCSLFAILPPNPTLPFRRL